MSLENMPDQIVVSSLMSKPAQYRADKMSLYSALYEGGDKFEAHKHTFLPKRPIEKAGDNFAGHEHYQSRLNSAFYTNYAGGLIDWFSAKIVENNPRIECGDDVSEESEDYWEGLNENADGRGTPLVSLCRSAARDILVNLRSYFAADFDNDNNEGKICLYTAQAVDDWDSDDNGDLIWVRRHTSELIRDPAQPWLAPTTEAHYWTYFDAYTIVVYRAEKPIEQKEFNKNDIATKISETKHDFGLPVFDVRSDSSMWIMDRIKDPIIKLFRREASLNWYLDSLCYQMPVFKLNLPNNYTAIPVTPMGALVMEIGESAEFLKPDAAGFGPNFEAVEQCKKSFYESLQVLAKEAAALPQAGRLSGEAVTTMQKPMQVLIGSFAWPIRDALNRLITRLKEYRGEQDKDISLVGFDAMPEIDDAEVRQITGVGATTSGDGEDSESGATGDAISPDGMLTQKDVLNGAQVTAASSIVSDVAAGVLPRSSGVMMLETFFNISKPLAEELVGTAGTKSFKQPVEEGAKNGGAIPAKGPETE